MSKTNYTFCNSGYTITFTHEKKRNYKHSYFIETIQICCQQEQRIFETVLNADSTFRYFDSLNQFYNYIKKNKKREIVEFDGRGFLSIKVETEYGEEGAETINLIEGDRLDEEAVEIKRYNQHYEKQKTKLISKMQKTVRNCLKEIPIKEKKDEVKSNIVEDHFFQESLLSFRIIDSRPNSEAPIEYHIFSANPIYEFKTNTKALMESGFKVIIRRMICEKIVLGICYTNPNSPQKNRHECEFGKSFLSSFKIEEGHQLEMILEDECDLVIRNLSNNNGKVFETRLSEQAECTIYLSLSSRSDG